MATSYQQFPVNSKVLPLHLESDCVKIRTQLHLYEQDTGHGMIRIALRDIALRDIALRDIALRDNVDHQ